MKRILVLIILISVLARADGAPDTFRINSPSGKILVNVWDGKQLQYEVSYGGLPILAPSVIGLRITNQAAFGVHDIVSGHSQRLVNEQIVSPIPEKRRNIPNRYNELTLQFRKPYTLIFRVYDDGVAYRIGLLFKDSVTIDEERASFAFPGRPAGYLPLIHKREDVDIFHTSFEELYQQVQLDSLDSTAVAYSPVLITPTAGPAIAITESDLEDYPGMFLQGMGVSGLRGVFAHYPITEKVNPGEYPQSVVTDRARFIARTVGKRMLPWRVLLVAPEDKDLPGNDLVYRLASPSRIADPSWVHPGKGTDEWIINTNLFGVPFVSGVNTATYKYYIDFAKRFGFDRIMMDAGWSEAGDLFKINPAINMDTIAAYAAFQGIKLSMWTLALTLDRQLEAALDRFNTWGVDFIMTDFIDRDDQKTVNFYHRIAAACARHKIMIMYHGAFPPKGFNRTWPNAVSREGVLGSEYNIWSDKVTPGHDLILPFTRMLAGSFDYEPGNFNNAARGTFRMVEGNPMSQGTRCHQLAMFLVYDDPMPIFSGNPSQAWREPAFTELLGAIPTGWDTTVIIDARIGQYIVTARKKGNEWWLGGMTDWTARDIVVPLGFLGIDRYSAEFCIDGMNANRYAGDYRIETGSADRSSSWPVHLAPGGGFLLRLRPE